MPRDPSSTPSEKAISGIYISVAVARFIKYPVKVVRESRYNSKRPITVDMAIRIDSIFPAGVHHICPNMLDIPYGRTQLCWVMPGIKVSTRRGPWSDLQRGHPPVYILSVKGSWTDRPKHSCALRDEPGSSPPLHGCHLPDRPAVTLRHLDHFPRN